MSLLSFAAFLREAETPELFVAHYTSNDGSVGGRVTRVGRTMSSPYRLTFTDGRTRKPLGNIVYTTRPAWNKNWMLVQRGGIKVAMELLRKASSMTEAAVAETLNPRSPILSAGTRVRVPHKGRMVSGKIVRYDKGDGPHGWPLYVVDVGEYGSVRVPIDDVWTVVSDIGITEAKEASEVKCADCNRPLTAKEKKKASRTCDACDLEYRNNQDRNRMYERMYEATQRPLKVGDYVHAGFAVKGGAGFSGRVDKIDGNYVYVNISKDQSVRFNHDPIANWGDRIIKAPIKNVSLQSSVKEAIKKPWPPGPTDPDDGGDGDGGDSGDGDANGE
jgi:preprotein translocase subunit YajC